LDEKWEIWKRKLKDERMKEGESGAGIKVQMRTRTRTRMRMRKKKSMKDDVEMKEVRVGIEDMMERKECSSRKKEDRVGEIVAISEMEADEKVGF
jgi:hypothetical protein